MMFEYNVPDAPFVIMARVLNQDEGLVYTEDKNDPGGATYYGMTYATLSAWMTKRYQETISTEGFRFGALASDKLLIDRIYQTYYDTFWLPMNLNNEVFKKWPIDAIFSFAINTNVSPAIEAIQKTLNAFGVITKVDGSFGPTTQKNLTILHYSEYTEKLIRQTFIDLWTKKYTDIVQANCDAWEQYTAACESAVKCREEYTPGLAATKPKWKRWKYLEGWMNRALRYS